MKFLDFVMGSIVICNELIDLFYRIILSYYFTVQVLCFVQYPLTWYTFDFGHSRLPEASICIYFVGSNTNQQTMLLAQTDAVGLWLMLLNQQTKRSKRWQLSGAFMSFQNATDSEWSCDDTPILDRSRTGSIGILENQR